MGARFELTSGHYTEFGNPLVWIPQIGAQPFSLCHQRLCIGVEDLVARLGGQVQAV